LIRTVRPKSIALYAVLLLVLLGLIAVSAYSLRQYVRLRESRRLREEQLSLEIQSILEHCRDQIRRHPDYDLGAERAFLTSFAQGTPKDQLQDLSALKAFSRELAEKLLLRSAGIKPGDDLWDEGVRYKTCSPNGFRDLYEQLDYTRAEPIVEAPWITGDPAADRRIVELATGRGYRLRQQADETALVAESRHSLQEAAMNAWRELQAAARAEGVELELVSAYRSVERQRQIFLGDLRRMSLQSTGRELDAEAIAAGEADHWIEEVLRYSSIPGFSKHHSGYTIDIADPSQGHAFTDFRQTGGFAWISAHNFLNVKRFGFIPSYPAGAVEQGPEPEPWEYVWVGRDLLLSRSPDGQ
jgi:D-alanyl-D-alanine carboxypeptidase